MTLVETLVASAMSLVLLSAVSVLITSSVTDQPQISQKNANIQTARWVLERLTREIRLGASVQSATSSSVSLQTYVRRPICGGNGTLTAVDRELPAGDPVVGVRRVGRMRRGRGQRQLGRGQAA